MESGRQRSQTPLQALKCKAGRLFPPSLPEKPLNSFGAPQEQVTGRRQPLQISAMMHHFWTL